MTRIAQTFTNGWLAALAVCALLACLGTARADTRTWGGVNTNWNDTLNWTSGIVPTNGDTVVVANTSIKPTMPAGNYPTNGSYASFQVDASAVVTCQGATNVINEGSGGVPGAPHGTGVTINCQSALINGTLSADTQGFNKMGGYGGPGWGSSGYGRGGTYGGIGSKNNTTSSYGSLKQPTALGSDGHTDAGGGLIGGGAIRVNATGTLTLNGLLSANGGPAADTGAGSGGSLWLACNTFQGNGTVRANGGGNAIGTYVGSGSGGRVAIEYNSSTFNGGVSVAPGVAPSLSQAGRTGTLFQCVSPVPGTTLSNSVTPWLDTQFSVNFNDLQVTRTVLNWGSAFRYKWTDSSLTLSSGNVRTNVATYTMKNLAPFNTCQIYNNGVPMTPKGTNTGANGILTFSATLDSQRTLEVALAARGTLITIQ